MSKWRIGAVTVSKIVELELGGGTRFILPQATPETVQPIAWLRPHFVDENGKLRMAVQALVVDTPTRRIIVDTCLGNNKENRPIPRWNKLQGPFLADLAAAGYPRESIDTVLCTHLHVDHVGWRGGEGLIPGDFTHPPCGRAHPEWSSTADDDPRLAERTRRDVFSRLAGTSVLLLGTHFVAPTAGRVVRDGDAFRLV